MYKSTWTYHLEIPSFSKRVMSRTTYTCRIYSIRQPLPISAAPNKCLTILLEQRDTPLNSNGKGQNNWSFFFLFWSFFNWSKFFLKFCSKLNLSSDQIPFEDMEVSSEVCFLVFWEILFKIEEIIDSVTKSDFKNECSFNRFWSTSSYCP